MKKRKMLAMALSVMMAVSAIPAALPAAAVADSAIQPYSIPEVGSQFYVEGVSAPTQTALDPAANNMTVTSPIGGNKHENWYNASGVIFGIKPTEEGTWLSSAEANSGKSPYLFFSVLALAEQKVDTWSSGGNKAADNYATFWTSDYFCDNKGRGDSQNPRVVDESGLLYYSEDNGLTWKSMCPSGGDGIYRFHLADVRKDEVLIYIPMEEFFYYGGYNGAMGTELPGANGVTASKKGFTNFGHGVEILKNNGAAEGMNLGSLILSCHAASSVSSGSVGAASAVTASDIRLVYHVAQEVKTVRSAEGYSVELYACEPAGVTDAVVTARIGEREEILTGTVTGEGRMKYVLEGLTEQNVGEIVTFTWASQALGVELVARDKVKRAEALQTLPSQLTISDTDYENSPLWGANAVYAGDSLMYASRDGADGTTTAIAGWPGRIAKTYSMTFNNYAIGGRQLSNFVGRGNASPIYNQMDKYINAQTAKEREAVEYVILNGGINDINRDGVQMGAMTDDFDGFDVRTYAGALEYTFSVARRAYPNATVGFIILFQMPRAIQSGPAKCQDEELMRQYVDLTIAICEKWGVPYLNMFDDQTFNDLIDTDNPDTKYMDKNDMLHLNKAGYELTTPYVAAWMKSLEKQYVYYDQVLDGVSVALTNGAEVTVWTKDIAEATDAKLTVSVSGAEPIPLDGVRERGRVKYSYRVDFWQLGDKLTFTWSSEKWHEDTPAPISKTTTISVRDYCRYLIATSGDEDLVSLASALLQYGGKLQTAEGYKTDAICSDGISAPPVISWEDVSVIYENPDETVFANAELITSPTLTLRLTVNAPDNTVSAVAYRVDGSREYGVGSYELTYITNGIVEIPLECHELGKSVAIWLVDQVGARKPVFRISGFYCMKQSAENDPLAEALAQYAVYADRYIYSQG